MRACGGICHDSVWVAPLRLGLWGEPDYAFGSRFAASEGEVAARGDGAAGARASGGVIYMNLGRRRSQALAVTILKRHERRFAAVGLQGDRRACRRRLVRGYKEECPGARNAATRPGPIGIAQDGIAKDEIAEGK
jgi:hypothetical protein